MTFVAENFYNHFLFLFFNFQLQVIIMQKFGGERGGGGSGKIWSLLWQIGGALTQPDCNEIPCRPKIFKANQIAWFFYTEFKHHDNKFWLLINFGVPFKVSLKVKLTSFLKFKIYFFHQNVDMGDRNVNSKVTYVSYMYF